MRTKKRLVQTKGANCYKDYTAVNAAAASSVSLYFLPTTAYQAIKVSLPRQPQSQAFPCNLANCSQSHTVSVGTDTTKCIVQTETAASGENQPAFFLTPLIFLDLFFLSLICFLDLSTLSARPFCRQEQQLASVEGMQRLTEQFAVDWGSRLSPRLTACNEQLVLMQHIMVADRTCARACI